MDRMSLLSGIADAAQTATGLHAPADAAVPAPSQEERVARLVRAIELDIIPRLVSAHKERPVDTRAGLPVSEQAAAGSALPHIKPAAIAVREMTTPADVGPQPVQALFDIAAFARLSVAGLEDDLFAQVDTWLAEGMSPETLFVDLVAPTARRLGEWWAADRCSFSDVTVGAGRLHQVLRRLSAPFGAGVVPPVDSRRILLMPAPGEQHTLGLTMVGEYFTRAAWEVMLTQMPGASDGRSSLRLPSCVRDEWFDVVGFSLGRTRGLESLREAVAEVRRLSRNRAVGVLVGGDYFNQHPDAVAAVGADATAADGAGAPLAAECLLASRFARVEGVHGHQAHAAAGHERRLSAQA
jgi:MerR family transcriptional regulator, light-induced transcriptional regulator